MKKVSNTLFMGWIIHPAANKNLSVSDFECGVSFYIGDKYVRSKECCGLCVVCVCFIFFFRDILDNVPYKKTYLNNFYGVYLIKYITFKTYLIKNPLSLPFCRKTTLWIELIFMLKRLTSTIQFFIIIPMEFLPSR